MHAYSPAEVSVCGALTTGLSEVRLESVHRSTVWGYDGMHAVCCSVFSCKLGEERACNICWLAVGCVLATGDKRHTGMVSME